MTGYVGLGQDMAMLKYHHRFFGSGSEAAAEPLQLPFGRLVVG